MSYNQICAAVLMAVGLCSCATPPPNLTETRAASPIFRVSSETWSWGVAVERWTLDSNGAGSLTTTALGADATPQTQAFKLSVDTFSAVVAALEPLAEQLQSGIPCRRPLPTDMPMFSITWSRKANSSELSLYGGCASAEADQAFAAIANAREIALSGVAK